jgi:hypothetical protein
LSIRLLQIYRVDSVKMMSAVIQHRFNHLSCAAPI